MKKLTATLGVVATAMMLTGAEAPRLKVGLITDTHIGKTEASCRLVRKAMILFKKHQVDLVVNLGDIADRHYPTGYLAYRKVVDQVFAGGKKPKELFVYAYHDRIDMDDIDEAFRVVKKNLGAQNDPYDKLVLNGYTFLVFPQTMDVKRYERTIAQAVLENPVKPVFVLDHVPPFNTVYNSKTWGDSRRRRVMEQFPTAVHLSGHVHGSMFNELNIWQGKFTAVNAGSLTYWDGALVGTAPPNKYSEEVTIMAVYGDRLDFHRYALQDGQEICQDRLWSVPWPFDPFTAPYRLDYRRETSSAPAFAASARLSVVPDGVPFSRVTLSLPEASPEVMTYTLVIQRRDAAGDWQPVTQQEIFSNFHELPKVRKKSVSASFSSGYFESGQTYRFQAIPVNFYGKPGQVLERVWQAPEKASATVVYECRRPMEELSFMSELADGRPMKREGDFYVHDTYNARLMLPRETWKGERGTRFRFILDMHTIQGGATTKQWTLVLRNPQPLDNANARIATLPNEAQGRYVIEFSKRRKADWYYFLIREGVKGLVRFDYVRIERLD